MTAGQDKNIELNLSAASLKRLWALADIPGAAVEAFTENNFEEVLEILEVKLGGSASSGLEDAEGLLPTRINPITGAIESFLPGEGKAVLVVDDLGIVTHQLSRRFKRLGYSVDTSSSREDAMDKFTNKDYDFVVMDLLLPSENDGFALLEGVRKLSMVCQLTPKIVVISASHSQEYKDRALKEGAELFLEKGPEWYEKLLEFVVEGRIAARV